MAEYTLKDYELAKDMPNYSGGPAKVLKLTLEDPSGATQEAELFTMASTDPPTIGAKIEGEIESGQYGPKFKKAGGRRGGGGGKSPAQEKRIVRQHSQEMALRREQNLLAAGGSLLTDQQMTELIGWFEADAFGKQKQGVISGVNTSDVPVDTEGLPPEFGDPDRLG